MRRGHHLDEAPADRDVWPRLTVVVPALNEERTIEPAMRSLLAVHYPSLQVIAVDDRSTDGTGAILDRLAAEDTRLIVQHVTELPSGWLGKTYALHVGSQAAEGDWILFTDADVHFAPDALCRAVALAEAHRLDHLVVFPDMEMPGFLERLFVAFFAEIFTFRYQSWQVGRPRSKAFIGVGAFNMVRTASYRAMGGHTALPMDVTDDLKLGKKMKEAGGRAEVVTSGGLVCVRWIEGVLGPRGAIAGLGKNAYAGLSYRPVSAVASCVAVLMMGAWPAVGLWIGPLAARGLCAAALALMCGAVAAGGRRLSVSSFYGLGFPIAAALFAYIIARSMVLTHRQGGIVWRGTLYPLADLRRGIV